MPGYFELVLRVDVPEDHPLVTDPKVYENGSDAQDVLMKSLVDGMKFGSGFNDGEGVRYTGQYLDWTSEKRILDEVEIRDLALNLHGSGPVRLPDDADEADTLNRLTVWHPGVHVAERTELDGVLVHA